MKIIGKISKFTKKVQGKVMGITSKNHPHSNNSTVTAAAVANNSTRPIDVAAEGPEGEKKEFSDHFKDQMSYFEANADD